MFRAEVRLGSILATFILSALSSTSPIEKHEPTCCEVVIPVTVSSTNILLDPAYTLTEFASSLNSLNSLLYSIFGLFEPIESLLDFRTGQVQGQYNITGRFCDPEVNIPARANTLQLLAHPATYDRNYWSGGGYPGYGYNGAAYSWVAYASKQGYPTFAFDRLGNGNSSKADPISEVQCPAQAATIHEMIGIIRGGPTEGSPLPRAFNKIILIGCSLGSIVANIVNANYPTDVDATILTGFSHEWLNVVPGFVATAGLLPAPGLPIGYLQATSESGAAFLLQYAPYYDAAFFHQDFLNRGTITVGEGVSGALGIAVAPQYAKPVFVITGQQDTVFCGTTGTELTGAGNCGIGPSSTLAQTKSLYPNHKANYTYYALNDAGHCWEHGDFAQLGFYKAHAWMYEQGF